MWYYISESRPLKIEIVNINNFKLITVKFLDGDSLILPGEIRTVPIEELKFERQYYDEDEEEEEEEYEKVSGKILVLEYIKQFDTSPLKFSSGTREINVASPLKEFIFDILIRTADYGSVSNANILETMAGCNRSSLDIWRHAKYYLPDITIFEVMECLNYLVIEGRITSLFCNDVKRRVFYVDYTYEDYYEDGGNYHTERVFLEDQHGYDTDDRDEYGLFLEDWGYLDGLYFRGNGYDDEYDY